MDNDSDEDIYDIQDDSDDENIDDENDDCDCDEFDNINHMEMNPEENGFYDEGYVFDQDLIFQRMGSIQNNLDCYEEEDDNDAKYARNVIEQIMLGNLSNKIKVMPDGEMKLGKKRSMNLFNYTIVLFIANCKTFICYSSQAAM